jgi:hypothetical protein
MIKNKVKGSIIDWNNRFPLDRWWRKKYKVSYLSEEHRKSIFFNQYFEYLEEETFNEHLRKVQLEDERKKNGLDEPYRPMEDNWWKAKEVSKEEADNWFKKTP